MAYPVSERYTELRYIRDNDNKLYMELDGQVVENASSLASSLKWTRRIIDSGSRVFKLDNFVSQLIEFTINDFNVEDIDKEFYFKIGSKVDNEYEYVPLGYYHIKDNPTTAGGKTTYKLIDRSSKFDKNIDLSTFIEQHGGKITKLQAVQEYCRQCGVEFGDNSFMGSSEEIGIYDNTITARIHISYLAESACCWATIGRDGKLHFIPLNKPNNSNTHILPRRIMNNAITTSDKSFKITKVLYEGALMPFVAGDDTGDTLFINTSNPYISKQEDITRIYNQVNGLEIDNVNTGYVIGNPAIDPWDYVQYSHVNYNVEEWKFTNLAQYDLEFNGVFRQNFNTEIDRQSKQINSTAHSETVKRKRLEQKIDTVEGSLSVISDELGEVSKQIQVSNKAKGNPIEIEDAGEYLEQNYIKHSKSYQETRIGNENLFLVTPENHIGYGTYISGANTNQLKIRANNVDLMLNNIANSGSSYDAVCGNLIPVNLGDIIYFDSGNTLFSKNLITVWDENKISLGYGGLGASKGSYTINNVNVKYVSFRFGYQNSVANTEYILAPMVSKSPINGYIPYGSMPSPDYPSEVKRVEGIKNEVLIIPTTYKFTMCDYISGANTNQLKIKATSTDARIGEVVTTGSSYQSTWANLIPVTKGDTIYYNSGNDLFTKNYFTYYNSNKISLGFYSLPNKKGNFTITDENVKYVSFRFGYQNSVANTEYILAPMVSKKPFDDYVPYGYWLEQKTRGNNQYKKSNVQRGYYLDSNGNLVSNSSWSITDYLLIDTNIVNIYYGIGTIGTAPHSAYYDANKNYISSFKQSTGKNILSNIPSNAKYVRFSIINEEYGIDINQFEFYYVNYAPIDLNKENLYNSNNKLENAQIDSSGNIVTNSGYDLYYIPITPSQIYTLKIIPTGDLTNTGNVVYGFSNDIPKVGGTATYAYIAFNNLISDFSFKTNDNNKKYLCIRITKNVQSSHIDTILFYEGIGSENHYSFGNLNNSEDIIENNLGKFKTARYYFTGNETITKTDSGSSSTKRFAFVLPNSVQSDLSHSMALCSHFKLLEQGGTWDNEGFTITASQDLIMRKNGLTMVDEFKSFLKTEYNNGTPVYIDYVLETPYEIELKSYEPLKLLKGYNYITDNDELESDIEIEYLTDSNINVPYVSKAEWTFQNNKIQSSLNKKVGEEELTNSITQAITDNNENYVAIEVGKKVNTSTYNTGMASKVNTSDYTAAKIIAKINADGSSQNIISADKVDIEGKAVRFKTNINQRVGPFTNDDKTKVRNYINGSGTLTPDEIKKYDINGDGKVDALDYIRISLIISSGGTKTYSGTYEINPYSYNKSLALFDNEDNSYDAIFSLIYNYIKQLYSEDIRLNSSINGPTLWLNADSGITLSNEGMSTGRVYFGCTLYENASGSNGTISLYETSANFTWLDIYFNKGGNRGFTRVYSPNGKTIMLILNVYGSNTMQTLSKSITISGTSITVNTNSTGYGNITNGGLGSANAENMIYITRVDGWKG